MLFQLQAVRARFLPCTRVDDEAGTVGVPLALFVLRCVWLQGLCKARLGKTIGSFCSAGHLDYGVVAGTPPRSPFAMRRARARTAPTPLAYGSGWVAC